MHAFEVAAVRERLREAGGGYEIVHESAGLEVGVYVSSPRSPTDSSLTRTTSSTSCSRARASSRSKGSRFPSREGSAVFVEAGADHRFTAYEHLSVLVIFERKPAENP